MWIMFLLPQNSSFQTWMSMKFYTASASSIISQAIQTRKLKKNSEKKKRKSPSSVRYETCFQSFLRKCNSQTIFNRTTERVFSITLLQEQGKCCKQDNKREFKIILILTFLCSFFFFFNTPNFINN